MRRRRGFWRAAVTECPDQRASETGGPPAATDSFGVGMPVRTAPPTEVLAPPAIATALVVSVIGPAHGMDPVALAALGTVLVLGLGGAYVRSARFWRRETYDALSSERWRIACDLHDGLPQDLACIAAQGQRLDCHLDPDHPLMLASRQALVSVRDVIM